MPVYTSDEDLEALLPTDLGPLIVQPLSEASVAFQVSDVIPTSRHSYTIPLVTDDPTASWVAEGQEITESDPSFDKLTIDIHKLAGLTEFSNEALDDPEVDLGEVVSAGLSRDFAKRVDLAFFGDVADPDAPRGLESPDVLAEVSEVTGNLLSLDIFAEAASVSAEEGGNLRFFVASPTDLLTLATLKKQTDSIEPVLSADVTRPGAMQIGGVTLLRSRAVQPGTIWGIDPDFSKVILRKQIEVKPSTHAAFTRDSVLIRAIMRLGFGFPSPKTIVRINVGGGS